MLVVSTSETMLTNPSILFGSSVLLVLITSYTAIEHHTLFIIQTLSALRANKAKIASTRRMRIYQVSGCMEIRQ